MPPPLPLPPIPDQSPKEKGPTRRQWIIWLVVMALLVAVAWPAGQFLRWSERVTAENGVRSVLADQEAAWNRGDLDGFMAGYWNDERLRFQSGGDVTLGWQPTFDRYHKKYQADGKEMGALTFSELVVEPLGPEVALAHGRWALVYAKSEDRPHGLFTLVVRKTPDGWKVVHDHTSAADPPKKN